MSALVAVAALDLVDQRDLVSFFKQTLLLYDHIALWGDIPSSINDKYVRNNIDWLLQNGLIEIPKIQEHPDLKKSREFLELVNTLREHKSGLKTLNDLATSRQRNSTYRIRNLKEKRKLLKEIIECGRQTKKHLQRLELLEKRALLLEEESLSIESLLVKNSNENENFTFLTNAQGIRYLSHEMRLLSNVQAYPIYPSHISFGAAFSEGKVEVLKVILNSLPIPDDSAPWEKLLEFKSDAESKRKILGLRNWIHDISRQALTRGEIEDKLEHLIHDYRKHLELHKMKYCTGVFETVLTTGMEIIENLLKIKWGEAARSLFKIRHQKIALLEAELKTPCQEVAYIYDVRTHFGNNS